MEQDTAFVLPFSTGLTFSRSIPFKGNHFTLSAALVTIALSCAHIWYADASGILLFFFGFLLLVFSVSPTTLGLNLLAFVSCAGVVQSLTSGLSLLATNSWHLTLLLPEGKLLLWLYACDFAVCFITFLFTFHFLYVFDPCRHLVESSPLPSYGTDLNPENPLHVWRHDPLVVQLNIPHSP